MIPVPTHPKEMAGDNGTAPIKKELGWIARSQQARATSVSMPRKCRLSTNRYLAVPMNSCSSFITCRTRTFWNRASCGSACL